MIKNKVALNKVISIFFVILISVTFLFLFIQYKNSKEILIQSYLNKYALQSLQIKEKFKNVFDWALYVFKTHQDEDLKKLYLLPKLYNNGKMDLQRIAWQFNSNLKIGHYEIFIIDRNYKIIDGTYKPDIGYDLGKFPAFRKVLQNVFDGREKIDISNVFVDVSSMNLKKYYLIRSPDGKYLLQLAYVIDIYDRLKKIYDFIKPAFKAIDIYFVNEFLIYKINLNKRFQKKEPVLKIYENAFRFLNEIMDSKHKKEDLKNTELFQSVIDAFKKKHNIIEKLDLERNELKIYMLISSIFEQVNNRVIIKTVYDVKNLKESIDKLFSNLLYMFVILTLVFILLYFLIIHRVSQTIIKLVNHMKKNEVCNECDSFIEEIEELKYSYNSLHAKLNKEIDKNKNLLELNRRFIVDTIHQIRTPLNVIMLNMDLLKFELEDKNVHEILEEIDAAVAMLNNSYEDLAYLSSNTTAITYKPTHLNISKVLNERIAFFTTIAKVNDKRIIADVEKNVYTYINRIEFERIVDNNISNAIKYSSSEDIKIELKKRGDKIVMKFYSYGEKIKNPEKIFEKNYREQTHKRGLGLGLNIVKNICDKYSIRYKVYYENGKNVFEYVFKV